MTRLPWDPAEIGTHDDDLDHVADRLTSYAESASEAPSAGLVGRIQSALDDEPLPAAPWWRGGVGAWRAPVRMLAAAAVLVLGVVTGLALGQLSGLVQEGGSGSSTPPITSPSPSPSATPSPTLSPSPSDSPSPSPSGSPVSSARLITPNPTASPDEADETPEPDDDSGGNSGPGGGGGDNSGPGGGGDDSP